MTANAKDEASAIEQDVAETQDAMGETVEKLENKLNPREMTRSIIGEDAMEWTEEAWRLTKENPLPVAMMVGGAIWLLATARSPLINRAVDRIRERLSAGGDGEQGQRSRRDGSGTAGPPPAAGEQYDRREQGASL